MGATRIVRVSAVLCMLASGCVRHSAPRGFLLSPNEAQQASFGGWIDFTYQGSAELERVAGELFAASADSLWVRHAEGVVVVPTSSVRSGQFVAYDSESDKVGGGTIIGMISTISNGAFLILTAPMWAIGGAVAARKQSRIPISELPTVAWEDLRRFSRFPQGIPGQLEWQSLPLRGVPAGRVRFTDPPYAVPKGALYIGREAGTVVFRLREGCTAWYDIPEESAKFFSGLDLARRAGYTLSSEQGCR